MLEIAVNRECSLTLLLTEAKQCSQKKLWWGVVSLAALKVKVDYCFAYVCMNVCIYVCI